MHDDTEQHRDVLQAILTDPEAAEALLASYTDIDWEILRSVAAQNAIFTAFPRMPSSAQIRTLASGMRKRFGEPIDSFTIVTLIESCFHPDQRAVTRRLDSLPLDSSRRMAFLLPHGLYSTGLIPAAAVDYWTNLCLDHYVEGKKTITASLGEDMGGFYRVVCVDPAEAAMSMYTDETIPADRRYAMVILAGITALGILWPEGAPDASEREHLITYLQRKHGEIPIPELDRLIDVAFVPSDSVVCEGKDMYTLAMVLPSAMVDVTGATSYEIVEFAKLCRERDTRLDQAMRPI